MRLHEDLIIQKYSEAITAMKRLANGITTADAREICTRVQTNNALLTMLNRMGATTVNQKGFFVINRNDVEALAKECRMFTRKYAKESHRLRKQKQEQEQNPLPTELVPRNNYLTDTFLITTLKERGYNISKTETINY